MKLFLNKTTISTVTFRTYKVHFYAFVSDQPLKALWYLVIVRPSVAMSITTVSHKPPRQEFYQIYQLRAWEEICQL